MRLMRRLAAPTVHLLAMGFFPCTYSLYVNREAFCHPQIPGFEVELGDADV